LFEPPFRVEAYLLDGGLVASSMLKCVRL
jgi:hypothetical protein